MESLKLVIEFSGGAELLFNNVKKHNVEIQLNEVEEGKWTVQKLIFWLKNNMLKERPELFVQVITGFPSVLCLVLYVTGFKL